jgi:hypothetical protein
MPEDRSSKSLLSVIAVGTLMTAITAFVNGKSLFDFHVLIPFLTSVALLVVTYVPKLQAAIQQQTAGQLERFASDARVWLALLSFVLVYFAAVSLIDRQAIVRSQVASASDTTSSSGWPLPSKSDLSDLSDELREYQPDLVQIIFDDPKNEPLALDFAKAMHQANWPDASMADQPQQPRLGIKIFAGAQMTGVLEPLKRFCRRQLKTEPTIETSAPAGAYSIKAVSLTIGHNESD